MTKYVYLHVVQGFFTRQYGREDVTQSEDARKALTDLKAYRESDPSHRYRKIRRRQPAPGS